METKKTEKMVTCDTEYTQFDPVIKPLPGRN